MIVRPRPGLRDLLFAWRGTVFVRVLHPLLFIAVVSIGAVLLTTLRPRLMADLSATPFTLIGISLSIFMSFRNTACYDRWWEGRKLWGRLINATRGLARQTGRLAQDEREPLLLGLCAFAAGLATRLRGGDEAAAVARWAPDGDGRASPNPTDAALRAVGMRCLDLMQAGRISPIHYGVIETQLTELGHVQGGCERIKTTPLPFSYTLLLHRTAYLFCLLLPFALAHMLGWWTPLVVLFVSYAFFGLDALSDELGDPFGNDPNDLPLDALVRAVERELLAALGREDLPPMIEPRDFVLP